MTITIREVAEKAGVSKATVSYVLNGRSDTMRISPATSERILNAARELGYHPNALARGLTYKRTQTIAVVMQYPALFSGWSGFINALMHGVTDSAVKHGYDLMLHTRNTGRERSSQDGDTIEREVAVLTDGRVDGALLLRDRNDPLASQLHKRGLPVVLMFTGSEQHDLPFVDLDNREGGRLATRYLLELGHRNLVHLAGLTLSTAAYDRRMGYRRAMNEAGFCTDDTLEKSILEIPSPLSDYTPLLKRFERPVSERPAAIFAWSDDVAIQAVRRLSEAGVRVPDDVSVIGFDSTELCNHTAPPLTSVRQPIYEMAERALTLLTDRINGGGSHPMQVTLNPEVVIRQSCRPAR